MTQIQISELVFRFRFSIQIQIQKIEFSIQIPVSVSVSDSVVRSTFNIMIQILFHNLIPQAYALSPFFYDDYHERKCNTKNDARN